MRIWVESIRQDVHYALRTARKSPGFVLAAVGTLALGIGATTAIFSILSGVLLRPLPFSEPRQLVQVSQADGRIDGIVYFADMEEWRKQSRSIEEIAGYTLTSRSLLDITEPERIQGVQAERARRRLASSRTTCSRCE